MTAFFLTPSLPVRYRSPSVVSGTMTLLEKPEVTHSKDW